MPEEKTIYENEILRMENLVERREAGFRTYMERKHKESEERKELKKKIIEECKKLKKPKPETKKKKRKVGRPKKRGPKKKRKYVSRKPKIDKRSLNVCNYKIVACHNGKQVGYIGQYTKVEDAYEKIEKLLEESKKIIFPARIQIGKTIGSYKNEYLLLEKNRYGDKEAPLLRNEFGKLVKQETNSDIWIVSDKFSYDTEETFWVYGHDPLRGRKTFEWIYHNIILGNIETKFDIKRIMLYKNKIVVKDDNENLDIVFCKTVGDAVRFYNLLSEWVLKNKNKQVVLLGNYGRFGDKRKMLEAELIEKTGWTKRKLQMPTTKKCRL